MAKSAIPKLARMTVNLEGYDVDTKVNRIDAEDEFDLPLFTYNQRQEL